MKDTGRIKNQFNTDRQDGKVLDGIRPIMQERAYNYKAISAKNKKSLLLTFCLIIMAILITTACFTPTVIAYANSKSEPHFGGWVSQHYEEISFEETFGESGENGVYYFGRNHIASASVYEQLDYDKRTPDEKMYSQYFNEMRGKVVLKMYMTEKRYNCVLYNNRGMEEGTHKGITYYYANELTVEGICFILEYGDYDYSISYASVDRDASLIPAYIDLLFKLD